MAPEINVKRLELLKEAVPGVSRVVILWSRSQSAHGALLKAIERAAPSLGVQPQPVEIRHPSDLERIFRTIAGSRADALYVIADPMLIDQRGPIAQAAAKNRLPTISATPDFPDAGGLMSYSANFADMFHRAAVYVDKIFKGAKPGDLPIEQPTRFELVINLRTAKAFGLTIPHAVLLRADRVIQ